MSGRREEIAAGHPEDTLRGQIVRAVWDSSPWITYAQATETVDRLCAEAAAEALESALDWINEDDHADWAIANELRERAAGLRGAVKGSESALDGLGGVEGMRRPSGTDDTAERG